MKEIGGYFSLELNKGEHLHPKAIHLNTARNCLEYVLKARKHKKIYIPYYTCDVLLEPLNRLNINYEFYTIDKRLNPVSDISLALNECFLYTNYFGVKDNTIKSLAEKYGNKLIIDNSQAFFSMPIDGIDTFYSARKFFGVPDGAYLYTDCLIEEQLELSQSLSNMSHLLKRIELSASEGYKDYVANDEKLGNQPIKRMSNITSTLLGNIDYAKVKNKRINNFEYLHSFLASQNTFIFDNLENSCPMVYPFYSKKENLRRHLINKRIYVATYWNNVLDWINEDFVEYSLVKNLLPIPIDQRYGEEDMVIIKNAIYEG